MAKRERLSPARGPDSNRLDLLPPALRKKVEAVCRERARQAGSTRPCVDTNHACYWCQDMAAAPAFQPDDQGGRDGS